MSLFQTNAPPPGAGASGGDIFTEKTRQESELMVRPYLVRRRAGR